MLACRTYGIRLRTSAYLRKKNGQADTLSRCPDYDQGDNDNKGLVVLPPKFFTKAYTRAIMGKKEHTSSARITGSGEADPNNGPEWRRYQAGIDPVSYDSLQRKVEKDQENKESQEKLRK